MKEKFALCHILLIVVFVFITVQAGSISGLIVLDDIKYEREIAYISGSISTGEGKWVSICISDKNTLEEKYLNQVKSTKNGRFGFEFLLKGLAPDNYKVEICGSEVGDIIYTTEFDYHPSTDNSIVQFSIGGKVATISNDIITIIIPRTIDIEGAIATFILPNGAYSKIGEVIQKSGITRNNFKSPVVFTVISQSGAEKDYTINASYEPKTDKNKNGGGGGGSTQYVAITPSIELPKPITNTEIAEKAHFLDVNENHWAFAAFSELSELGIIKGDGSGNVFPDRTITREEFVKLIVEAIDIEGEVELPFKDTNKDEWYYKYVQIAYANNIIKGIDDENFGIGKDVSRQDIVTILNRALGNNNDISVDINEINKFSDYNDISDYAKDSVAYMYSNGIIKGIDEFRFAPNEKATRAECITILQRYLSYKKSKIKNN